MKFKTYTGITWSILELTGLLEDEDSHVYFERLKKHFGLHPFHLTNLNAALNEILSSNLNLHDAELKGFLLAYKNPKLLTPLGEIFYDTCFIHVDIEADFYIFRPKVGCSLKGIVNKKGIDHIGVLVHKAFNVSIPKMDNDENWPGDNLEIGQEVRFKVTSLDFDSKLPFIRGILNPDDYLQGCKLMEKTHFNNHRTNDESIVSNVLETNSKQHKFFATDSENSSDEGIAKVKKETSPGKKSKKKFDKEKPTESIEIKEEDKKHGKKFKRVKESMSEPIKIEETVEQYTNSNTINGELESDQELKPVLKKRARKKSREHGSQSSLDEQCNEKSAKSPKNVSKSLCNEESKTKISRIKLEHVESSSSELVVEESEPKSKVKSKKHFAKRKVLDETDNSADDFTANKYITSSSKKKLKIRPSDYDNVAVKAEESYEANKEVEEFSIQKQPKRHKHSIKLEFPESDVDGGSNTEKTLGKRRSKTSSIADPEFAFHDINIKKETPNSSSENTENEDRVKVNKASKEKPDLNTSTNSSNHDTMGDNDTSIKKKRKKHSKKNLLDRDEIKIEPGFEDIVKVEIFDDDVYTSNKSSTKKKHKFDLSNVTSDDETDLKSNARHSKKKKTTNDEVICHDVKVKKEKFVTNVASERDKNDVNESNDDVIEKKQSKKLNKSRKFESEFDFSDVQVKTENCAT